MNAWLWIQHPLVLMLARGLLGVVFLAAAWGKIRHPRYFVATVAAYRLLPERLVSPFAYTLIGIETIVPLLLLAGWQAQVAAALCTLLLISFGLAVGVNLRRRRTDLDRGCFGARRRQKLNVKVLVRDLVLLLFSLPVVLWGGGYLTLDGQSPEVKDLVINRLLLGQVLPLALMGLGLYLVHQLLRQLSRLIMLIPTESKR